MSEISRDASRTEFIRVVCDRLKRTAAAAEPGTPQEDLRAVSADVREIVGGEFQRAWQLIRPTPAPAFVPALKLSVDPDRLTLAYAGGGIDAPQTMVPWLGRKWSVNFGTVGPLVEARDSKGKSHFGTTVGFGAYAEGVGMSFDDDAYETFDFPFHEYIQSTAIVFNGRKLSRQRIVQYIANTRGGNHWSTQHSRSKTKDDFEALDALAKRGAVMDRDPIFYQFYSIVREIKDSADVRWAIGAMEQESSSHPRLR